MPIFIGFGLMQLGILHKSTILAADCIHSPLIGIEAPGSAVSVPTFKLLELQHFFFDLIHFPEKHLPEITFPQKHLAETILF